MLGYHKNDKFRQGLVVFLFLNIGTHGSHLSTQGLRQKLLASEAHLQIPLDQTEKYWYDVADPWYTGDFETTWQDVLAGCQGLLKELTEK